MADPRLARERGLAFGLLILGGLAGLLLATQPWWTHPAATSGITGNQATASLAGVLAGAAAAGTGLAALSGRVARTVLAVLLLVLGVGMVVAAVTASGQDVGITPGSGLVPEGNDLRATGLRWAYAVSGILVGAGAGVLLLRARSWPGRRDRYARLTASAATTAEDDAADVWKALDAGFDPTDRESEPGPDRDPSGQKPPDRRE